jgi:hypothetical protein
MALISKVQTRDNKGNRIDVEFHENRGKITQRIKKNGNVTHDINYNQDTFQKVTQAMINTEQKVVEEAQPRTKQFNPENLEASTSEKVDMIEKILSTMNDKEIEQASNLLNDNFKAEKLVKLDRSDRNYEKLKEDVLDLIYEEFGFEWFKFKEFKEVYDINYNKSTAKRYIQKLKGKWIEREELDNSGHSKYKYRLSGYSREIFRSYGRFDNPDNEIYNRKKMIYNTG